MREEEGGGFWMERGGEVKGEGFVRDGRRGVLIFLERISGLMNGVEG